MAEYRARHLSRRLGRRCARPEAARTRGRTGCGNGGRECACRAPHAAPGSSARCRAAKPRRCAAASAGGSIAASARDGSPADTTHRVGNLCRTAVASHTEQRASSNPGPPRGGAFDARARARITCEFGDERSYGARCTRFGRSCSEGTAGFGDAACRASCSRSGARDNSCTLGRASADARARSEGPAASCYAASGCSGSDAAASPCRRARRRHTQDARLAFKRARSDGVAR